MPRNDTLTFFEGGSGTDAGLTCCCERQRHLERWIFVFGPF